MFDFTTIPELKLSYGAHNSAAEGVCFMEAIAFFEGLPHSDRPECACPVLTSYGTGLNDRMPNDLRNDLLRPLIPMVAGTRDKASEKKRAEFLVMWAVNKVLPIALRVQGLDELAVACERAKDLSGAKSAANTAAAYAFAAVAANARAAYAAAANTAAAYTFAAVADYASAAYAAANAAANAVDAANTADAHEIWTVVIEGFKQAIALGRCVGFAEAANLPERAEAFRALALETDNT